MGGCVILGSRAHRPTCAACAKGAIVDLRTAEVFVGGLLQSAQRSPASTLLLEQPTALAALLKMPVSIATSTIVLIAETAMALRMSSVHSLWPMLGPHVVSYVRRSQRSPSRCPC